MNLEDFYSEVLQKLGVLAAEEAPSPSDRLAAKDKYEQVHAEFARRDLLPWFDDEDVPDWAADSFSTIVASRLVNEFSVPQDRRLEMKVDAQMATATIIGDGQRRQSPANKANYY